MKWPECFTDCPKCKKARRNTTTLVFILFGAFGTGIICGMLYAMLALFLGYEEQGVEYMMKLPGILGATAYMVFCIMREKDLVCSCGDKDGS
jgi:hypothetical protein